ncbi:TetR/AcrR family transcriptional regulator C-terminal domain-containing protein [Kitasatospora sp. NBC_01287]|uniref:TetR/AcrR family transcriptional regulator C-terminal domain-containing protein n=1 Tax=Kitasatospora sp. NBC_01287 TaxID=2903573 RepID=UPI0022519E7E|nr:TetR/AcrR family transcriptional regulator C-terminal domain-containing protein [Kitasatospora sp. NBC_01287]MCX4751111.1 TetR/AcrR family transcriptional regulator C-terminal domain-containing protein [Kitasatospora sp. NBC_01287]
MRLHRPDVLNGAMALLDAEGLDGLTMRRLATVLDVRPSALYWHYRDKQALLEAIAEHLMAGVAEIDTEQPGIDQLAELARRLREALLSHRDGARVVSGTFVRQPDTLRTGEVAIRAALAAGIAPEHAALAFFTLQDYVLGHTIEEQSRADLIAERGREEAPGPQETEDFPAIGAAIGHWAAIEPDARFEYGLGLLLDGLRARLDRVAGGAGPTR